MTENYSEKSEQNSSIGGKLTCIVIFSHEGRYFLVGEIFDEIFKHTMMDAYSKDVREIRQ